MSHASSIDNWANPLKKPPPTSRLSGQCVLKRKGSPVANALKLLDVDGSQKLASLRCGRARRKPAHALSVTPTTTFTLATVCRGLTRVNDGPTTEPLMRSALVLGAALDWARTVSAEARMRG